MDSNYDATIVVWEKLDQEFRTKYQRSVGEKAVDFLARKFPRSKRLASAAKQNKDLERQIANQVVKSFLENRYAVSNLLFVINPELRSTCGSAKKIKPMDLVKGLVMCLTTYGFARNHDGEYDLQFVRMFKDRMNETVSLLTSPQVNSRIATEHHHLARKKSNNYTIPQKGEVLEISDLL